MTRAPTPEYRENVWEAKCVAARHQCVLSVSGARRPRQFRDTNVTWLGAGNSTYTSPVTPPGPYTGKTVYYHSSWTNANLYWRQGTNDTWTNSPMTRLGNGRSTNEYRYRITGLGNAAWPIEFVFNNGTQWDNAFGISFSNYQTPMDFIFVQDGHVFNYWPPATVSAPRFVTNTITSSYAANGISNRRVRALLPRGYTQNTNKRYPVLYMHDGQNLFSTDTPPFNQPPWDADATANREIQMGRMRETISWRLTTSAPHGERILPTRRSGQLGHGQLLPRFRRQQCAALGGHKPPHAQRSAEHRCHGFLPRWTHLPLHGGVHERLRPDCARLSVVLVCAQLEIFFPCYFQANQPVVLYGLRKLGGVKHMGPLWAHGHQYDLQGVQLWR